ncbi:MAG TPA: hypothetical protein VFH77_02875 [Streptomyces sp.]|jgi:hypothetical protein|nr:hypothetical protein [Streptomyces sp.]
MSDQTPSQAEGERDSEQDEHPDVPRTTPSKAEGERDDEDDTQGPA